MNRKAVTCLCAALGLLAALACSASAAPFAAVLRIDGPIGPAVSGYVAKAHAQAVADGAAVVVLEIDTPGGLDGAMRDIVKTVMESPVPVIGYVSPQGARAASAGTYILYATHVAAMAPATNLGAATPVPLGGDAPGPPVGRKPTLPAADKDSESAPGPNGAKPDADTGDSAMRRKVVNDAVAYIRALAEERGRNADWAERAVREGLSLPAAEALEQGVVDLIARDLDELLKAADGRRVRVGSGEQELATADLPLRRYQPDWRDELLAVITNPTIAYLLLIVGAYGLLLEGYNPGAILPGVVGAISLLLGLFALQILPVNYVGLGLMLLGIALMIGEAFMPSFGVLGIGGAVAFVFGSVMLLDTGVPGYGINVGVIAGMAGSAVLLTTLTVVLFRRSRHAEVVTGDAVLIGRRVTIEEGGWTEVNGERWQVRGAEELSPGTRATVVGIDGLTLIVKVDEEKPQ